MATTTTLVDRERKQVLRQLIIGHRMKRKGRYHEALEAYQDGLSTAIDIFERGEMPHPTTPFRPFSVAIKALSSLYETMGENDEAEKLLMSHFFLLKEMMNNRNLSLRLRDMARQEIDRSGDNTAQFYVRQGKFLKAGKIYKDSQESYYKLLVS